MRKSEGPACILALTTAVPPFFVDQMTYPDYFFDVTSCNNKVDLKHKFNRMCEGSGIKKRHFCLTREEWEKNPSFYSLTEASLADKLALTCQHVPELAKNAAEKAILQWGQDRSNITHVIFATQSMFSMPGPDYYVAKLLGLQNNVKRLTLYINACFSSMSAMRVAKDAAENNKNARVLVICCEDTTLWTHPPDEKQPHLLVQEALFGDGAAAVIVGSDPTQEENPIFEMHWTGEKIIPNTENAVEVRLKETGISGFIGRALPSLIGEQIEQIVKWAIQDSGLLEHKDLFWAIHCAGKPVLRKIKEALDLGDEKMRASEEILCEYGNLGGPSVLFVLENLVSKIAKAERPKWGLCLAMGPGVTFSALLLKTCIA